MYTNLRDKLKTNVKCQESGPLRMDNTAWRFKKSTKIRSASRGIEPTRPLATKWEHKKKFDSLLEYYTVGTAKSRLMASRSAQQVRAYKAPSRKIPLSEIVRDHKQGNEEEALRKTIEKMHNSNFLYKEGQMSPDYIYFLENMAKTALFYPHIMKQYKSDIQRRWGRDPSNVGSLAPKIVSLPQQIKMSVPKKHVNFRSKQFTSSKSKLPLKNKGLALDIELQQHTLKLREVLDEYLKIN